MKEKLMQYKNLILITLAALLVIGLIAADPLGFVTERRHQRAVIRNEMALEKAEAEKQIAIIKAQTDAELKHIENGLPAAQSEIETAPATPAPETSGETE